MKSLSWIKCILSVFSQKKKKRAIPEYLFDCYMASWAYILWGQRWMRLARKSRNLRANWAHVYFVKVRWDEQQSFLRKFVYEYWSWRFQLVTSYIVFGHPKMQAIINSWTLGFPRFVTICLGGMRKFEITLIMESYFIIKGKKNHIGYIITGYWVCFCLKFMVNLRYFWNDEYNLAMKNHEYKVPKSHWTLYP